MCFVYSLFTGCERGKFGNGCIDCGHCRYGVPCDFETGECPVRLTCNSFNCASANCTNRRYCPDSFTCEAGWQDDNCSTGNYLFLGPILFVLFVCFVALLPKSTAMVIAGRSVHLTTLFPGPA